MKNQEKAREIVTFFYAIFSHRIHEGLNPEKARHSAYDAVNLRYGISQGRLLNIISEQKSSHNVNLSALRQNAISLISELQIVNSRLEKTVNKNKRLIELLKECVEDDS